MRALYELSNIFLMPTTCALGVAFFVYVFIAARAATAIVRGLKDAEDLGDAMDDIAHSLKAMFILFVSICFFSWLAYCFHNGLIVVS